MAFESQLTIVNKHLPDILNPLKDRTPGQGLQTMGNRGPITGRMPSIQGVGQIPDQISDEGRQPLDSGCVDPIQPGQGNRVEESLQVGSQLFLYPGQVGGNDTATAGRCLGQDQGNALVEGRQDTHLAAPHQIGKLVLVQLAVHDHNG